VFWSFRVWREWGGLRFAVYLCSLSRTVESFTPLQLQQLDTLLQPILTTLLQPILTTQNYEITLRKNSLARTKDILLWPVLASKPLPDQPWTKKKLTLAHLLVAGNETLPTGQQNDWNRTLSRQALDYYGDQSEGSEDESCSDAVKEHLPKSRARRLRLARCLGVPEQSLKFAMAFETHY
jgi:hypothetical protein